MKPNVTHWNRLLPAALVVLAAGVLSLGAGPVAASVHTVRWGNAQAVPPDETPMTPTTAQKKIGAGSWHFAKLSGSSKCNYYINPSAHLGTTFTVNDIQSISYSTYNAGNSVPVEYFLIVYTTAPVPAHGWYDQRLILEPAYRNGGYVPLLNAWSTWSTADLTINDNNNSGNQGFSLAPTLADIQAGPINWSTWAANPTAGSANTNPITYGTKDVLFLSFQTGSASYVFDSYLDEITIALKNGETYVVDLETDDAVTPGPAPSCITPTTPCVTIPVGISRNAPAANMRGYSVTFSLSSNLVLCSTPAASVTEGGYLNGVSGTNFQVVDNLDGSYTVDCAILGAPCGATATTGTLFNINVKKAPAALDGTGTLTVTSVIARDCVNSAIPVAPGAALPITIDNASPTSITNLAASQVKTGNDADGTTKIQLTFTAPGDASVIEVYRAGYGHYPEYDDAGGAVPATPSYPPGAPWTLTGVTASGQADEPATRDFYYYVAFTKDACGNVSAVSNKTGGTLDYHLGDVHNGVSDCAGENQVTTSDISLLGAHYGSTLVLNDAYNCLDVGPTTDFSVNARPTTDNRVQFEDLILFAINYGQVSKPTDGRPVESTLADAVSLETPAAVEPGRSFVASVRLSSGGRMQGISLDLDYDRTVVEPVAVEPGELMARQGSASLVLSSAPGNVDVALLGQGATIVGTGELARVTFRVLAAGDARVALRGADARDTRNEKVRLEVAGGTPGVTPVRATYLGANYPNPFHGSTTIPLGLAQAGPARLAVFDVAGRLVRTLVDGPLEAGPRVVEWDGRDDGGRAVASGFYVIRLTAPGDVRTRSVKIVR